MESKDSKESKLTIGTDAGKKTIEIDIEKQEKIKIRRGDGEPEVTGHDPNGPTDKLIIDGREIPNVFPDDTVIFTHHSPGCGYYCFGGRWWYR